MGKGRGVRTECVAMRRNNVRMVKRSRRAEAAVLLSLMVRQLHTYIVGCGASVAQSGTGTDGQRQKRRQLMSSEYSMLKEKGERIVM